MIIPCWAHQEILNYLRMMAQMSNIFNAPFYSVRGKLHTSLSTPIKDGCPWTKPAIKNKNMLLRN